MGFLRINRGGRRTGLATQRVWPWVLTWNRQLAVHTVALYKVKDRPPVSRRQAGATTRIGEEADNGGGKGKERKVEQGPGIPGRAPSRKMIGQA